MGFGRAILSWLIDVASAAALGIGLLEVIEFFMPKFKPDTQLRAICIIVIAVAYVVFIRIVNRRPRDQFAFKVGGWRFYHFYAHWYRRKGRIFVFCDELDWLEGPKAKKARDALGDKGHRATICVRDLSSEVVEELRARGVHVREVPEALTYDARLSLRSYDGVKQLIIRQYNRQRADVNVFRQTTDPYLVDVVVDIFHAAGVAL